MYNNVPGNWMLMLLTAHLCPNSGLNSVFPLFLFSLFLARAKSWSSRSSSHSSNTIRRARKHYLWRSVAPTHTNSINAFHFHSISSGRVHWRWVARSFVVWSRTCPSTWSHSLPLVPPPCQYRSATVFCSACCFSHGRTALFVVIRLQKWSYGVPIILHPFDIERVSRWSLVGCDMWHPRGKSVAAWMDPGEL